MLQQQAQPSSNDTLTKFLQVRTHFVQKMLPVRYHFSSAVYSTQM
jgi:hypothetical protein